MEDLVHQEAFDFDRLEQSLEESGNGVFTIERVVHRSVGGVNEAIDTYPLVKKFLLNGYHITDIDEQHYYLEKQR